MKSRKGIMTKQVSPNLSLRKGIMTKQVSPNLSLRKGIMTKQVSPNLSLRKGITPVIAVVLLLMITVALIGFAFIWFQGVWEGVASSTEENIQSEVSRMTQTIKIDNVDPVGESIYIRATGSSSIPVTDITVYINNVLQACTWSGGAASIPPKGVVGCVPNVGGTATDLVSGSLIKVTSPGTSQGDVKTVS